LKPVSSRTVIANAFFRKGKTKFGLGTFHNLSAGALFLVLGFFWLFKAQLFDGQCISRSASLLLSGKKIQELSEMESRYQFCVNHVWCPRNKQIPFEPLRSRMGAQLNHGTTAFIRE